MYLHIEGHVTCEEGPLYVRRGKRAESKALLILCRGTFLHFPKICKCTLSIMSKITIKCRKMCFIVMDELYKIIK